MNPPPTPYHLSGSSPCTSPKHPVSCIKLRLAIHFLHDSIHVSMPFSQIILPSPSESKSLHYTSVFLLLSHIQGYHYHLSKFHIHVLVYCIGVSLSGLLHCVGVGEGGMIWDNGIETCILSCKKRTASLGSIQDIGCLGLVH